MLPDGRFKIKNYNKIIREALDLSTRGCCANAFQVLLHTFVTCPKGIGTPKYQQTKFFLR